jgi:carbamoyl-phosphate synthase large subunit
MRSTGEVLGVGKTLEEALYKGFIGANMYMKKEKGTILATINDHDKEEFLPMAVELSKLGYKFMATTNTAKLLKNVGIEVKEVRKLKEEHPNIIDVVKNGEVDLVVNTPTKGNDSNRDGFHIRRAAIERNIGVITALDTFNAMVKVKAKGIKSEDLDVYDLGK